MKSTPRRLGIMILILLGAGLVVAPADAQNRRAQGTTPDPGGGGQLLFEAGWMSPYSDLGDDFNTIPLGAGAGDGMELGFRWRFPLSPMLTLGPSFHFINHRDLRGRNAVVQDYRVGASSYRYAVELRLGEAGRGGYARPFIAIGTGLTRNRFVGFNKDFSTPLDESVNVFGLSLRAGVLWGGLEWSLVYNLNRFTSRRFYTSREDVDYDWDTVGVRVGWTFP